MRRRDLLAVLALASATARAHDPFGPVDPPQVAASMLLRGADGSLRDIVDRLRGHATAVQLMFTTCSAVCPIQGALFAAVAEQLRGAEMQLLSLSIDPLNDDPRALAAWLARFGARPTWQAAAPRVADVDRLLGLLAGRAAGPDRHSTQVYLFDRRARLVHRTPELPKVAHVVEMLQAVARIR